MQFSAVFGKIAVSFRFLPGKMPFQVIRRKEGRFLPIITRNTPKTYSKRSFLSLFHIPAKNGFVFCLVRRFPCLGGIKLYLKKKTPLRGFLGVFGAICLKGITSYTFFLVRAYHFLQETCKNLHCPPQWSFLCYTIPPRRLCIISRNKKYNLLYKKTDPVKESAFLVLLSDITQKGFRFSRS